MDYSRLEVTEDAAVGSSLGVFAVADDDDGDAALVHFSIVAPSQSDSLPFRVEPTTGWLMLTAPLDRETTEKYHFSVVAKDRGAEPLTASIDVLLTVVDVNDEPPKFFTSNGLEKSEFLFEVAENSPEGTTIGRLLVRDADLPPHNQTELNIVSEGGCSP